MTSTLVSFASKAVALTLIDGRAASLSSSPSVGLSTLTWGGRWTGAAMTMLWGADASVTPPARVASAETS